MRQIFTLESIAGHRGTQKSVLFIKFNSSQSEFIIGLIFV